jgi:uncharacterized membrane protein (DUF106 family)
MAQNLSGGKSSSSSSLPFFVLLMVAMFVMFDQGLRTSLGNAVGTVFSPLFGFDHAFPVLTIFMVGSIALLASTAIRHVSMDWVEMAKNQQVMSKFQKEYRQARLDNNTYKIKKLEKLQPKLMKKQGEVSSSQMKIMPVTLLIFIPIWTWIWKFLMGTSHYFFDVPWTMHVSLLDKTVIFPNWILLYMLLSIPLTQIIQHAFKLISWSEWRASHAR